MARSSAQVEFGDFQTSIDLAREICAHLAHRLNSPKSLPKSLIEPNCGKGSFLFAAVECFSKLEKARGFDINSSYLREARRNSVSKKLEWIQADFFKTSWKKVIQKMPQPLLILGNPPWVTNSGIGKIPNARNLPRKTAQKNLKGLDALTGKSNFDISEWMLLKLLEAIQGTDTRIALLVKTSVARKVLKSAFEQSLFFSQARLSAINSKHHFQVAVDAGLFEFSATQGVRDYTCESFPSLQSRKPKSVFGIIDGKMIADIGAYQRLLTIHAELPALEKPRWRSGIKHDCADIMELSLNEQTLLNGKKELVNIEPDFLYGFLKSSDLTKKPLPAGRRYLIVTQKTIGEDTEVIREKAPATWRYLTQNKSALTARKSSIYLGKPQFSIFGVGEYSFALWKVAISGLYKQTQFTLIGPLKNRPVMLDDTCYFVPFKSEKDAQIYCDFLNSEHVQKFLSAIIFWDAKRPINAEILNRIPKAI